MNARIFRKLAFLPLLMLLGANAAHADGKVAVIDMNRLQAEGTLFKNAFGDFKTDMQKRQAGLEAQRKAIEEESQQLQKNADMMSPEDRLKKQKELQDKGSDFDFARAKAEEWAQQRQAELSQQVGQRVHDVCQQVSREKGFDYVMLSPAAVIVYPQAADITSEVLTRLNASSGLGSKK